MFGGPKLRLALLDMYDGTTNQGMRCINDILSQYSDNIEYDVFDVRGQRAIPDTSYDIYISSGGPGDPREGDGLWDADYYALLDELWRINQTDDGRKKYVFFICHSFQMACIFFKIGQVKKRSEMSFGTFPVYPTDKGITEPVFDGLSNPFWVADFRRFQVIQPDLQQIKAIGAQILALEKPRPNFPQARAIMAVRFSDEFVGVQFHPEADATGMLSHFRTEKTMVHVLNTYGKGRYESMIKDLSHPAKIEKTNLTVIPNFLNNCILQLKQEPVPAY